MSEKVEQVARAICENHGAYSWEPDFTEEADRRGDLTRDDYRKIARAAIAAMREPTEAMGEAGAEIPHRQMIFPSHAESVWRAMIDKALE